MLIQFAGTEIESEGAEWGTYAVFPTEGGMAIHWCVSVISGEISLDENVPTQALAEDRLIQILTQIKEGR